MVATMKQEMRNEDHLTRLKGRRENSEIRYGGRYWT